MRERLFIVLMMCWMTSCLEVAAQEKELETAKDSVALDEVVVKAARVVNKADGKLIFPSEVQKEHSHSGFSLLGSLMLPNIRVDEASHSIAAIDQRGSVQVRINGIIANLHEVQALDVAAVTSVDFINNPGVRYGRDVAYVIDIRTRRSSVGGSVGFDFTNALTTLRGTNDVYASLHRGKSQFHLFYEQSYADCPAIDVQEEAQYLLNDGTEYRISRNSLSGKTKNFGNNLELKYALADSASYVFQTTLSAFYLPATHVCRADGEGVGRHGEYRPQQWEKPRLHPLARPVFLPPSGQAPVFDGGCARHVYPHEGRQL